MENKENLVIPYLFPTDYHLSTYQEGIGYEPYVNYIGFMRDVMEKTLSGENFI